MTLDKVSATEIFGEQWEGYEIHSFPIKDGVGYYLPHTVDNTRTVETHYEIRLIWNNGDTEESTAESEQELKLWTEHLR
jgi:hypothetical protein